MRAFTFIKVIKPARATTRREILTQDRKREVAARVRQRSEARRFKYAAAEAGGSR